MSNFILKCLQKFIFYFLILLKPGPLLSPSPEITNRISRHSSHYHSISHTFTLSNQDFISSSLLSSSLKLPSLKLPSILRLSMATQLVLVNDGITNHILISSFLKNVNQETIPATYFHTLYLGNARIVAHALCTWKPPPPGVLKINADSSYDEKNQIAYIGYLLRDSVADHVYSTSFARKITKSHLSEFAAIASAVDATWCSEWDRYIVEGDNKPVIDSLVFSFPDRRFTPSYVNREGNEAADFISRMSKKAFYTSSDGWIPVGLRSILNKDRLPIFSAIPSRKSVYFEPVYAYAISSNQYTDPLLSLFEQLEFLLNGAAVRSCNSVSYRVKLFSATEVVFATLDVDVMPLSAKYINTPPSEGSKKQTAFAFQQLAWILNFAQLPSQIYLCIEVRGCNVPGNHFHLGLHENDDFQCPALEIRLGRIRGATQILVPKVLVTAHCSLHHLLKKELSLPWVDLGQDDLFAKTYHYEKKWFPDTYVIKSDVLPLRFG